MPPTGGGCARSMATRVASLPTRRMLSADGARACCRPVMTSPRSFGTWPRDACCAAWKPARCHALAFSPDGKRALLNGVIWDLETGERLVSSSALADDEWLAITPEGYFAASAKGAAVLSAVRGLEVMVHRPVLPIALPPRPGAREARRRSARAGARGGGEARSQQGAGERQCADRDTAVAARRHARDGRAGDRRSRDHRARRRHRARRVARQRRHRRRRDAPCPAGRPAAAAHARPRARRRRERDRGGGLQRRQPRRLGAGARDHDRAAATAQTPARMFVLAVGLNDYAEAKFKLAYAVPDAKALAQALSEAGKGVYESVEVTLVQDAEVQARQARCGVRGACRQGAAVRRVRVLPGRPRQDHRRPLLLHPAGLPLEAA